MIFFFFYPPSFVGNIGTTFQCHSIHQDHICTDDSDKVRLSQILPSQDAYALGFLYIAFTVQSLFELHVQQSDFRDNSNCPWHIKKYILLTTVS